MVLANLMQLHPWTLVRGAAFEPAADASDDAVAAAVRRHPALSLAAGSATLSLPGVNIGGGTVDVGDLGRPLVCLAEAAPADVLAACELVAPHVGPARVLVRDAYAVRIGPDFRAEPLNVPWREHLIRQGAEDLLYDVLLDALSSCESDDDMAEAVGIGQEAVGLRPDDPDGRLAYARLLVRLGHDGLAADQLEAAIRCEPGPRELIDASVALAEVRLRMDDPAAAAEALRQAGNGAWRHRPLLAVALARAGRVDEARRELHFLGVRRYLGVARALHRLGRADDARALVRVALMAEPDMLEPVPDHVWPKPPDLDWAHKAGLGDLIASARRHPVKPAVAAPDG
jgi:hypothetical protein